MYKERGELLEDREISCLKIDLVKTGRRIKETIFGHGYTVRQIQEYLQLSCPQPIYRWFKGKTLPSVDNLFALSRLLHVHMEDLLVEVSCQEDCIYCSDIRRRILAYVTKISIATAS